MVGGGSSRRASAELLTRRAQNPSVARRLIDFRSLPDCYFTRRVKTLSLVTLAVTPEPCAGSLDKLELGPLHLLNGWDADYTFSA